MQEMQKKKKKKEEVALAAAPEPQGAARVPTEAAVVLPGMLVLAVTTARAGRARAPTKCHWGHWVQAVAWDRVWLVLVGAWAWA